LLVDAVRFESGPNGTSVWLTLFGGPSADSGDETAEILRVVMRAPEQEPSGPDGD
jgi:hypothetical protein